MSFAHDMAFLLMYLHYLVYLNTVSTRLRMSTFFEWGNSEKAPPLSKKIFAILLNRRREDIFFSGIAIGQLPIFVKINHK